RARRHRACGGRARALSPGARRRSDADRIDNRRVAEHIVHWDEVEGERADEGAFRSTWTDLGRAAGSVTVGVKRVRVDPGARSTPLHMEGAEEEIFFVLTGINYNRVEPGLLSAPPHCHSAEEEIFVILDGEGTALLDAEERPVRRGHVVARPAATRVAHAFRAGDEGLTMLAYGTRDRER